MTILTVTLLYVAVALLWALILDKCITCLLYTSLAIQGLEYLTEGKITLPVDSANRELLLGIRNGEHTFEGRCV